MTKSSLVRVKTPIHLFTYSPIHFHPSIQRFRRAEPKWREILPAHQNWSYATKPPPPNRTATMLIQHTATALNQIELQRALHVGRRDGCLNVLPAIGSHTGARWLLQNQLARKKQPRLSPSHHIISGVICNDVASSNRRIW